MDDVKQWSDFADKLFEVMADDIVAMDIDTSCKEIFFHDKVGQACSIRREWVNLPAGNCDRSFFRKEKANKT